MCVMLSFSVSCYSKSSDMDWGDGVAVCEHCFLCVNETIVNMLPYWSSKLPNTFTCRRNCQREMQTVTVCYSMSWPHSLIASNFSHLYPINQFFSWLSATLHTYEKTLKICYTHIFQNIILIQNIV